jgi:Malate synthase
MGEMKITIGGLEVDETLFDFVTTSLLSGSNRDEADFWVNLESLLKEFSPRMEHLLRVRDDYQSQIDDWHVRRRGNPHDHEAYTSFLTEIGYVQERPTSVQVDTKNVDPEIASIPGPQLVVPVDNARYAINAANARWGSLYDALYGTDVISEDDGAEKAGAYNPVRGAKVIAYGRSLLDQHFPLNGISHTASAGYKVINSELRVHSESEETGLIDPEQFVGFVGNPAKPDSVFLKKHGLHVEIGFYFSRPYRS